MGLDADIGSSFEEFISEAEVCVVEKVDNTLFERIYE